MNKTKQYFNLCIRHFWALGSPVYQLIELMAISRKTYPCREIEMAERLTGKNESGRLSEIPNTKKTLAIIEVTSMKNARSSIIPFPGLVWCYLLFVSLLEGCSLIFLSIPLMVS